MTCVEAGCDRRARSRGLCNTHYVRHRRHGDIDEYPYAAPDTLPNPWALTAPACPWGHEPAQVFLWAPGPLQWYCMPCGRRFEADKERGRPKTPSSDPMSTDTTPCADHHSGSSLGS